MFFYGISFVLDLLLHTIGACKLWSVLIHICDLSLCVKCVQKIICYYVSAENVYTLVICASVSICFYTTLWISDFLFSWPDCWRFYKHKSSLCAMLILIVKVCSLYSSHFFSDGLRKYAVCTRLIFSVMQDWGNILCAMPWHSARYKYGVIKIIIKHSS